MGKLDDLIAATLAASQRGGCFAPNLTGDAAKYVEAMTEAERSGRYGKISRPVMKQNLAGLGADVSEERVRAHLLGRCDCA